MRDSSLRTIGCLCETFLASDWFLIVCVVAVFLLVAASLVLWRDSRR